VTLAFIEESSGPSAHYSTTRKDVGKMADGSLFAAAICGQLSSFPMSLEAVVFGNGATVLHRL